MRRIARQLSRVRPGTAISLAGHGLLLAALFLLPGLGGPAAPAEQPSLVTVAPDAPPDLLEPEPPLPADPAAPAEVPLAVEPHVLDRPPTEPDVFADAPAEPTAAPAAPDDFAPSRNPPIGIGPRPPAPPAAPPAPAPRAAPRPPRPAPTPAEVLAQPLPEYPRIAEERGLEGVVVLLVEVLPDGRTGRIEVKSSSGHAVLDRAAIAGVRKWEFRPATVMGQPVRSLVEVPVRFSP